MRASPTKGWIPKLDWLWPDIGLGTKMTALAVAATITLIGLVAYLGSAALGESTQRTLQDRVVLAQTNARHSDHVLAGIQSALTDAASTEDWSSAERRPAALQAAYRRLDLYAARVFLLDATGRTLAAAPPITTTVSFGDFASVASVLKGQSFTVSRYTRSLAALGFSTVAAVPTYGAAGAVAGALVVSIDLSGPRLRTFADPIGLGATGYLDLVDLNGVVLASTRSVRIGIASDHGETLAGMVRDHRTAAATCHDCHGPQAAATPDRQVLAFAPLESAQWGVAVRQSEDEVFAAAHDLQTRILALMAVVVAGAVVLVFLTTRRVIQPIQQLTAATRRIAAGDLDTAIDIDARDEIGALARSFDAMRARLNAWNRELDLRVQERADDQARAADKIARLYSELQRKELLRRELLHRVISVQEEECKPMLERMRALARQDRAGRRQPHHFRSPPDHARSPGPGACAALVRRDPLQRQRRAVCDSRGRERPAGGAERRDGALSSRARGHQQHRASFQG
ncbi:MAG: HAMP domain-containing protein [Chloroflexi bacterium]|nr:HAMP domain-containing protein [Chloroflexota bacterium]